MQRYLSLSAKKMVTSASTKSYQRQAGSSLLIQQKRLIVRHSSAAAVEADESTTTSLKPWPQPAIESQGDYRAEAFLEQHIGGPLYAHQATLPHLPIPNVEDTITKFLSTALPLAESDEEKQSLLDASASFPADAAKLQQRLQARRDVDMNDSSWLQLWWNQMGYLQVRDPVVVNVSYFFHFSDDGTLPAPSDGKSLGVMRGASMLVAAAEYRKKVCSGSLPCEAIGRKDPKTPLCSAAFKYMFNACRVPARAQDTYKMYDPSLHQHCIISRKGYFFSTKFVDEYGDPLPLEVMESKLQRIVQLADEAEARGDAPMLGWLSSNDRDSWADARDELLKAGGAKMEAALEKLQSGALLLCLDDEDPISRKQCGEVFWTGGVTDGATSGHNRWFDKSVQLLCTNNGKAGLLGEHSMMDGMPVVGLADHITKTSYRVTQNKSFGLTNEGGDDIENIFQGFDLPTVDEHIANAKSHLNQLVGDHDLNVQSFQGYGSNYIKKAGFSPDAYVQMAIQLATYRLWGQQGATYEATQMRPFLHGRTETTRTVSPASAAFVKTMGPRPKHDESDEVARKEKLDLLRDAVGSHVKYITEAAKGKGVDRHFLGLSMMVEDGEEAPALYAHPVFARAKTWRVSTSHLTHKNFDNWGFGEVVSNGVGVGYAVKADCCVFNITARKEHQWTERLSHLLEEALLEMQILVEMDKAPSSRL
eukprot:CAMPEP_0185827164 /NCGR_PEP_ID=MMETSP1322-20130828/31915_1 /TAXON_ID=265543 /ORGANISM="Minutocellus polymorphus, Strain RCC2270" /LENGTH=703 /DNA_ID=CAMNT_0028524895 /DNA_START=96 /DNA_END=2207 /DNA_ORIENTATION=-